MSSSPASTSASIEILGPRRRVWSQGGDELEQHIGSVDTRRGFVQQLLEHRDGAFHVTGNPMAMCRSHTGAAAPAAVGRESISRQAPRVPPPLPARPGQRRARPQRPTESRQPRPDCPSRAPNGAPAPPVHPQRQPATGERRVSSEAKPARRQSTPRADERSELAIRRSPPLPRDEPH